MRSEIEQFIADRTFNRLAMKLGVKVIHCSERDTQISDRPSRSTSSSTRGASRASAKRARRPPRWAGARTRRNCRRGPTSTTTARATRSAWPRWASTPGSAPGCRNYTIRGMVVRHGEAFTISDKLTVWEDGKAVYRPTVHYAYCPCDAAIASLNELRGYDYELQPQAADHGRRDHHRRRHPRRAVDGPRLQFVVDRQRPEHRRIAPAGARIKTRRPCRWRSPSWRRRCG